MTNSYSALLRQRSLLLDQMSALDRMERGRLFEQFIKGQKDGKPALWGPYYVLQRRVGQEVRKERVPAGRLSAVRDDIQKHEQFLALADRYAQLTEEMARLQDADPELKKKPPTSSPTSSGKPRPS